jgi:hypothetical protein
VNELSSYAFSPLREGDIALYRGSGNGLAPILLAAAADGESHHREEPARPRRSQCCQNREPTVRVGTLAACRT